MMWKLDVCILAYTISHRHYERNGINRKMNEEVDSNGKEKGT